MDVGLCAALQTRCGLTAWELVHNNPTCTFCGNFTTHARRPIPESRRVAICEPLFPR